MKHLLEIEPARLFFALRTVVYLIAGAGLFSLSPEHAEAIIGILALLLGVDAASTQTTRSSVFSTATVNAMFVTPAGQFVRDQVAELVPSNRVTDALGLVARLALEHANAEMTDELRADLQRRVHEKLRRAGLLQGRDLG